MEIGNQIKQLRLRRGITQEAMAQHFGITAQAVSKWERGAATPDIDMLPDISAYFGVTIDDLFALSDDTRMERIENMIWDVRVLEPADVQSNREFLLDKAKREPKNGKPHLLLAQMENHLAGERRELAMEYARESLRRDPEEWDSLVELVHAMNGKEHDWNYTNHYQLIDFYKEFIGEHPEQWHAYMVLLDQLIDDYRLDEADEYCRRFAQINHTYRVPLYEGMVAWQRGAREKAFEIWKEMERSFPDDWCVWHNVGDYLVRSGRFDEGMTYYRKALEVQKVPRLLDPCEAMAQLCEIRGDYSGAIRCLREQVTLMEREWHITSGEARDAVLRNIDRLEKKIEK